MFCISEILLSQISEFLIFVMYALFIIIDVHILKLIHSYFSLKFNFSIFFLDKHWFQNEDSVKKNVIVICGPSGSGKSTLLKLLMNEYPECFGFSISRE